jgi:FtsP/CotA-like multicopper oxidase with cupredoxin domain
MSATGRNGRGRTLAALIGLLALAGVVPAGAQSFRVQCPQYTNLHPNPQDPAIFDAHGNTRAPSPVSGALAGSTYTQAYPGKILCQQISGGDGMATMGDGHQIYLFGFGPLSGLQDIYAGLPGTQTNDVFNSGFQTTGGLPVVAAAGSGTGGIAMSAPNPNNAAVVEPAQVMSVGVLNASQPGPLMAINEDDEFFLTLSNVGMINRPDLFEQHTVHFHGYPNASSYFDGVPDASVAINIAGSFTYYYTAPDAGTYFWHCHIAPPEHLQMGMVGQLFVRPRQNALPPATDLYAAAAAHACNGPGDFLCSAPLPIVKTGAVQPVTPALYAYNDGDGSTAYDVDVPIQMMSFDPNFHFVGMTFNQEDFSGMKDKYFMLNGRGYPDTIIPNCGSNCAAAGSSPIGTMDNDTVTRMSQPLPALVTIDRTKGQTRALLRISQLTVSEYSTLATIGVPMKVVGWSARLLRDMAGNNMYYLTNSITVGGGESADVIIDVSDITQYPVVPGTKKIFYLYSTNLDHLANDAENFGGQMSEIVVQD